MEYLRGGGETEVREEGKVAELSRKLKVEYLKGGEEGRRWGRWVRLQLSRRLKKGGEEEQGRGEGVPKHCAPKVYLAPCITPTSSLPCSWSSV